MREHCARLILLLVILLGVAGCAVLDSGQTAPALGVSPRPSPRALSPLAVPSDGVAQLVSPLPSPTPGATRVAAAAAGVAPDFSLQRENGQMLRLSDMRGKTVVLVFYRGQT